MTGLKNFIFSGKAFPSILIFFLVKSKLGLEAAATLAALYAILYTLAALAAERITKLDYGMVCFWVGGVLAYSINPILGRSYLAEHFTSWLYLALFLAAYLPLVLNGEPFTVALAKRQTAKGLWKTEQFQTINRLMTIGWSLLFLICLLLTLLPSVWSKLIAPLALSLLIGIPFTKMFPAWYLRTHGLAPESSGREASGAIAPGPQPLPAAKASAQPFAEIERQRLAAELGPVRKAVVIFGSPRAEKGHTFRLLEHFVAGLREAGVTVETMVLANHTIRPCRGCFSCWSKTPGQCIHQDDMAKLSEQADDADLLVYAQPLYVFSVPGIVKNFLDRRLPRLLPYLIESSDGATRHPHRQESGRRQRLVVFSVCGFPELDHFAGLLTMFRQLARAGDTPIVGELLRPASESLRFGSGLGPKYQTVLAALHRAGKELATQGFVSTATEQAVSQPLFPNLASFRHCANRFWDTNLRYSSEKKAGQVLPSLEEYLQHDPGMFFAGMAATFDPPEDEDFTGIWQFRLSGAATGSFYLAAEKGTCLAHEGEAAKPDLTISTDWELWRQIAAGAVSGQQALMAGRYQAAGDLSLLTRMKDLFAH